MSTPLYISRNYTEIGPFSPLEIADFIKRGILRGGDHLRLHGADEWIEVESWSLPPEAAAVEAEQIVPSHPLSDEGTSTLPAPASTKAKPASKKAASKKAAAPAKKAKAPAKKSTRKA